MRKTFEQEAILGHIDELNNRISRTYYFVGEFNPCSKTEYVEKARALEIVKYNLNKRVKMKPVFKKDEQTDRYSSQFTCPSCGGDFTYTGMAEYCYHCGQALEWDESEE